MTINWTRVGGVKFPGAANGGTTTGTVDTTTAKLVVVHKIWYAAGGAEPTLDDGHAGLNTYTPVGLALVESVLASRTYWCQPVSLSTTQAWAVAGTGTYGAVYVEVWTNDGGPTVTLDQVATIHLGGDSTPNYTANGATPSDVDCLDLVFFDTGGTGTYTIDSGFTARQSDTYNPGTPWGAYVASKLIATPASNTPKLTWAGASTINDKIATQLQFLGQVAPPGATWAVNDMAAGEIIPVDNGKTYATIKITGTYDITDTVPVSVECQLRNAASAIVLNWVALTGTAISAGLWQGFLQVSYAEGYRLEARAKNGANAVIFTSAITTNNWGVTRMLVAQVGQSHFPRDYDAVTSPPAANPAGRMLGTTGIWEAPQGNGNIAYFNYLCSLGTGTGFAGMNECFGVVRTGIGGAGWGIDGGILDADYYSGRWWTDQGAAPMPFAKFKVKVSLVRGLTVNGLFILGGSSDAIFNRGKTTILADLLSVRAEINAWLNLTNAQLPAFLFINGRTTSNAYSDVLWTACQWADVKFIRNEINAYIAANTIDSELFDDFHYTAAGYTRSMLRAAQSVAFYLGLASSDGGDFYIETAHWIPGTNDVYMTLHSPGATSLKRTDGNTVGASLTAIEYSKNGFTGASETISATLFDSGKVGKPGKLQVKLTLASTPARGDTIRYLYGQLPSIANAVYDNTAPGGDSVGRLLQPTSDPLTVAVFFADSVAEAGTGIDVVTGANATQSARIETGLLLDAVNASAGLIAAIAEAASAADTVNGVKATATGGTIETGNAIDVVTALTTLGAATAETGNAADTTECARGSIVPASLSELTALFDLVTAGSSRSDSIAEFGVLADVSDAGKGLTSLVAELAALAEVSDATPTLSSQTIETATLQDSQSVIGYFNAPRRSASVTGRKRPQKH